MVRTKISPKQIKPGADNQVLKTVGGKAVWGEASGSAPTSFGNNSVNLINNSSKRYLSTDKPTGNIFSQAVDNSGMLFTASGDVRISTYVTPFSKTGATLSFDDLTINYESETNKIKTFEVAVSYMTGHQYQPKYPPTDEFTFDYSPESDRIERQTGMDGVTVIYGGHNNRVVLLFDKKVFSRFDISESDKLQYLNVKITPKNADGVASHRSIGFYKMEAGINKSPSYSASYQELIGGGITTHKLVDISGAYMDNSTPFYNSQNNVKKITWTDKRYIGFTYSRLEDENFEHDTSLPKVYYRLMRQFDFVEVTVRGVCTDNSSIRVEVGNDDFIPAFDVPVIPSGKNNNESVFYGSFICTNVTGAIHVEHSSPEMLSSVKNIEMIVKGYDIVEHGKGTASDSFIIDSQVNGYYG